MSYVKIGVGGPVGSGKTALIERLTRKMSKEYSICVITNDIYTKEDAKGALENVGYDLIALGHVIITDPDWVNKVKNNNIIETIRNENI